MDGRLGQQLEVATMQVGGEDEERKARGMKGRYSRLWVVLIVVYKNVPIESAILSKGKLTLSGHFAT